MRLPLDLAVGLAMAALALGACRLAPAEAPAPDADAPWPDQSPALDPIDEADLEANLEADPGAALDSGPGSSMAGPTRLRPPQTIFRDEIQRATGPGPAYLLRQLGPEPFRYEGHFVGWEITRLFPDDPQLCASACDLAVGDVILGINGRRLQTPQELSDALAALPDWTQLRVQSLRGGQRRDVTYAIAPTAE